ncbi:unnamed protein product [Camellia sinensis]
MSKSDVEEEQHEELRRRKLEEALEVKSLRRIISAYLNYPDAAEDDVKRYERSFARLPPAHKWSAVPPPSKISKTEMAFDPPIDMSQEIDICQHQNLENFPDYNILAGERNACSCQSASTSGRVALLKSDEASCGEGSNITCRSPDGSTINEEVTVLHINGSDTGSCSARLQCEQNLDEAGGNNIKTANDQSAMSSVVDSNGNVSSSPPDWLDPSFQLHVPLVDVDKVRCIIRNIVRDWAAEGQRERDQCYKPILEELEIQFSVRQKDCPPACLVPGAGLGRLALEISCLGMTQTVGEWTIYPWIHSNCNSLSDSDQLRPVSIPDIFPASVLLYNAGITDGFSMCGGDFVEVYSDPSQVGVWDAVVTCFFIDTAHNIVEYIEIISRILKDGGVWINLGPLLYHFADVYGQEDEMSIELSLEDVRRVAFHYGFQLEKEKTIETTYTTNPRSMMQNRYYTAFWTMRKKTVATEQQQQQIT